MENEDTIRLLRECSAGVKMAVKSIDDVLEHTGDEKLKQRLSQSKAEHTELGKRSHALLSHHGVEDKEPNPMARGMSVMKTGWKLGLEHSDAMVAELITDGCDMGIKSLSRYLNQYPTATAESRSICKDLIAIEDRLVADMRSYL